MDEEVKMAEHRLEPEATSRTYKNARGQRTAHAGLRASGL